MARQTDTLGWTVPEPGKDSGGPDGMASDGWAQILVDLVDGEIEPAVVEALASGSAGGVTVRADEYGGANGGEQIQNAIADLPAQGGIVFVPPEGPDNGDWMMTSAPTLSSGVILRGVPGATQITVSLGAEEHDYFEIRAPDGQPPVTHAAIEGLSIDLTDAPKSRVSIINGENCWVRDCIVTGGQYCFHVAQSVDCLIHNCHGTGARDDNYTCTDVGQGASLSRNVTFRDCVSHNPTQSNFEVDDGPRGVKLVDCAAYGGQNGYMVHTHNWSPDEGAPRDLHYVRCRTDGAEWGFRFGGNRNPSPEAYHLYSPTIRGASKAAIAATDNKGATDKLLDWLTISNPDIEHSGNQPAIDMNNSDEGVANLRINGGEINVSGGVDAIRLNAQTTDAHIDDVQTNGSVTDNGTRTLRNGVGKNAGDPSSTGEWSGHGEEGVIVYDTSSGRPFDAHRYVNGGWQLA